MKAHCSATRIFFWFVVVFFIWGDGSVERKEVVQTEIITLSIVGVPAAHLFGVSALWTEVRRVPEVPRNHR